METLERQSFITDEHLAFLDDLRESGATNMFGALPYLTDEFTDLDNEQAKAILLYWMKTFSQRNS